VETRAPSRALASTARACSAPCAASLRAPHGEAAQAAARGAGAGGSAGGPDFAAAASGATGLPPAEASTRFGGTNARTLFTGIVFGLQARAWRCHARRVAAEGSV
jgi:hypothetical protein